MLRKVDLFGDRWTAHARRAGLGGCTEMLMIRTGMFWLLLFAAAIAAAAPISGLAQQRPANSQDDRLADGQHDFDFEIGTWKTHIHRLLHPLTGSTTWTDYDGTSVVRKIWQGRANIVELEVSGRAGRIEGLGLRLYNPASHQWSLSFANSAVGTLGVPTIGEFRNGRGEFYDQEMINDRMVLVRNIWSDITPNSGRFEQAFSDDGGKTWEVNWIATDTRMRAAQPAAPGS
jgi:hypothetical protein